MRPTHLVLTVLAVLLVLAGASPAAAHAAGSRPCPKASAEPGQATVAQVRAATLCLVNRERARRGLRPMRAHAALARAASRYAAQMARHDFFAHVSPGGSSMVDRIRRTTYLRGMLRRWEVGENLAWGAGRRASPAQTVAAWMASPGHRANVLDRTFDEIGVGVATGAPVRGTADAGTYVANFGKRVR